MAAQLRRPFSANAARLAGAPEAAKRPSYFDRLAAQRAEDEGVASTLAPMERLPVIGGERAAAKVRRGANCRRWRAFPSHAPAPRSYWHGIPGISLARPTGERHPVEPVRRQRAAKRAFRAAAC